LYPLGDFLQAQQFKYTTDTFVPPYNQNVSYRRPVFQQPYGRPLGPVWSNIEPLQSFQENTVTEPYAEQVYNGSHLNQPVRDPLPQFMDPQNNKKKIEKKNNQSFFSKVIELFQEQGLANFYQSWMKEELNFAMNKISVAGLFFGLMFLGSLFFLIGFLVAVNLYGHKSAPSMLTEQRSVMPSQGAMLSGRTNQMMNTTAYPSGMVAQQPLPQTGSLQQNGRMPSSMQKQGLASSFQKQQRVPSFHISGN
jgi:hypothetical protein